jgi:hypothetical protein
MCTPSKRECRFGPLKTGKKLMRCLRFCSKMSGSSRRNECFEKRNYENRKCQKNNEQSTDSVGDDQKRLKVRTRKRHENVKCAQHFEKMNSRGTRGKPWASFLRHLPRETLILKKGARSTSAAPGQLRRSTDTAPPQHHRSTGAATAHLRLQNQPPEGGEGCLLISSMDGGYTLPQTASRIDLQRC